MLQNAYFLAKIGADTAENVQHFAGGVEVMPSTTSSEGVEGGRSSSGDGGQGSRTEQIQQEAVAGPRRRRRRCGILRWPITVGHSLTPNQFKFMKIRELYTIICYQMLAKFRHKFVTLMNICFNPWSFLNSVEKKLWSWE